ncbi:hypothetical protein PRNP1_002401 [Phytophthora ramorum]
MGAGASLGKFLKSMDDEELSKLVESAYKLDPQRMEKMFHLAKLRYYEEAGQQAARDVEAVVAATELSLSAALLSTPQAVTSSPAPPMLGEMLPTTPAPVTMTSSSTAVMPVATTPGMDVLTDADEEHSALNGVKDPMNALWMFEGHHLRDLQAAAKNPHNAHNQSQQQEGMAHTDPLGKNAGGLAGAVANLGQREIDSDGFPVMYGSCGRDKRYGRCSVCYFRGLRCNTAYYCSCCQRSVCIRPRKYPGEEHQKICWNVLHMDKEMIQRVEKKKKRKLHATAAVSVAVSEASRLGNAEVCHIGGSGAAHSGQNDSPGHSAEDLHRAPSIPTVVADVSGAVDL